MNSEATAGRPPDSGGTPALPGMADLLEVRNLAVEFPRSTQGGSGWLVAVRDLSFSIAAGEVLGLVGESGSGKSVTSLALMRLLPPHARISGEIRFGNGSGVQRPAAAIRHGDAPFARLSAGHDFSGADDRAESR